MKNIFAKIWGFIMKHKIISIVVLIVIIIVGYQMIKSYANSTTQTTYTIGKATKSTLISTVSGSGQVSASSQVDLKTQASGNISYLNLKVGQTVSAGTLLAQIDSANASYELENAKLAYDKLVTVDQDTLRKDENTLAQAETTLKSSYTNARITMTVALTDMSDVSTGLGVLFDYNTGYLTSGNSSISQVGKTNQKIAEDSWYNFDKSLTVLTKKYKDISASTTNTDIELILTDFYQTSVTSTQTAKDAQDAIIYLRNNEDGKNQTQADTAYSSIISLVSKANGVASSLFSSKISINNNKISLQNANADLATLKAGPDNITIRGQALTVKQKQDALANYSVTAPFTGVIASAADLNIGDTVSNGAAVATIITKQKVAEISLNEIDAAKVKTGQKVNLTFDAIDSLNITGTVSETDLIGTVSQGVVSYAMKISFDTQDDRVKSGMSVSASIITEAKTDVLTVPASAVKTQGSTYYVEIPNIAAPTTGAPTEQTITIGSSNDTMVEITSGLNDGDSIVTKTTAGTVAKTTTTASISSLLNGNRRGGN